MAQDSSKTGILHELEAPASDTISSVRFSPDGAHLLVASWDKHLYVYQHSEGESPFTLLHNTECNAPILDACFGASEATAFWVGLDRAVHRVDWPTQEQTDLSSHAKASNKIAYSKDHGIVLSTSWDGTMHVHDPESKAYIRIRLAAKAFAISLTPERAVVAMAERKVSVYDLNALKMLLEQTGGTADDQTIHEVQPWQERESSLKFMTRAIACMIDGAGFATSSIEGRVGVEWFDPELQKKTYAFKCHRDTTKTQDEGGNEQEVDVIYPVNALAFHPVHGTFATGGGDGAIALWDAQTKRRVRQYHKLPTGIFAMDFSPNGKYLAIGISPGMETGKEQDKVDPTLVQVFVREFTENEAKGKEAKAKAK